MFWGLGILFFLFFPFFLYNLVFLFPPLPSPNSVFYAVHLHVTEAAVKLEEAQADITPRLVVIARKEAVIYVSRRALGKFSQNECFRKCLRAQAAAGQSSPAGCVRGFGGGSPRQAPWMGWWAPGGPHRDSPWGAGENPQPGLRENHINGETKAGPSRGGGVGPAGTKYGAGRDGEKFRGRGIIIIMEVKM